MHALDAAADVGLRIAAGQILIGSHVIGGHHDVVVGAVHSVVVVVLLRPGALSSVLSHGKLLIYKEKNTREIIKTHK